ncbi:MAG: ATP-binding cassette domain-containing protein [Clostridiaceae bacterium]|nr:ATP-binding cassette domain-containing protein [Clostridiaceae bacterium]
METYRIKNLSFVYPKMEKKVLDNINLQIDGGEFVAICGKSGSGKSTLLRQLKTVLTPHGKREGEIYFHGKPLATIEDRVQASQIGYVLQNPDNQIVTDKVWHELAFGLESLGYDNSTIRLRVAEMASFFGIQTWFHKKVTELSGGQKQTLNLAGIMAMQPSVLILDEPTSQLDPIAAYDFLETIRRINRELGTTVIMCEHRLEEVVPIADRVIVMDEGHIIVDAPPKSVGKKLSEGNHPMFFAMPSAMQIYKSIENNLSCPITINEARKWIDAILPKKEMKKRFVVEEHIDRSKNTIIKIKDVWFKYEKDAADAIKDLSLEVKQGDFYCIVGGNGTGKTTTLSLISGTNTPYRGKVLVNGKDIKKISSKDRFRNNLAMLPQNPQNIFVKKTLELDLYEMLIDTKFEEKEKEEKVRKVVEIAELEDFLSMHPYDLSGGEQQRAALAKVLLLEPKILLLDEPTKGLDAFFKKKLATLLKKLKKQGVTIVMVSHDIEFCANYADICGLFFDGGIVTTNTTRKFFAGNSFYTTAANRIARHIDPEIVTIEDVVHLCQQS